MKEDLILNLFSLQYRRMRDDMIETYKIMSGLEDINSSQFFIRSNWNNFCGHSFKLNKEHFCICKVIRKEFFTKRVINQWNGLPEEVVKAKTLNSFKNVLENYWRRYGP